MAAPAWVVSRRRKWSEKHIKTESLVNFSQQGTNCLRVHAFLAPLTSQATEPYATTHEIIKADSAVGAVALHDDVHGLRAQVETCTEKHIIKALLNVDQAERTYLIMCFRATHGTDTIYTLSPHRSNINFWIFHEFRQKKILLCTQRQRAPANQRQSRAGHDFALLREKTIVICSSLWNSSR